jgi:hypothetical protein
MHVGCFPQGGEVSSRPYPKRSVVNALLRPQSCCTASARPLPRPEPVARRLGSGKVVRFAGLSRYWRSGPVEEVARALSGVDLTPFSIANGLNSSRKRSVSFSECNFRSTV